MDEQRVTVKKIGDSQHKIYMGKDCSFVVESIGDDLLRTKLNQLQSGSFRGHVNIASLLISRHLGEA